MHLSIHSIDKNLYDGEADKLVIGTAMGQLTILLNHIPLLANLVATTALISRGEEVIEVAIAGGVMEVAQNSRITILAEV